MTGEILAYIIAVIGILLAWIAYERLGYKVISFSIPLLASYYYLVPSSLLVIIVSFAAALLIGELAYRYLLFYGMRIFFLYSIISSIVTFLFTYPRIDSGVLLLSTLPGLLAYDIHSSRRRYYTFIISSIFFIIQVAALLALVNFLK